MNAKTLAVIVVLAVLSCSAVYAVSMVSADGVVHSMTVTSSGVVYLKIEQPDSTKVSADCMLTDEIRDACESSHVGDVASGTARCVNGYCTWQTDLSIIIGSGVGGSIDRKHPEE